MLEIRDQLHISLQALRRVLENPDLRRLEIAWTLLTASQWALVVALLVFTYDEGGSVALGVLGLFRTLPTLVGVPLATTLGDRFSRVHVLLGAYIASFAASAAAAVALAVGAPLGVVFLVAAWNAVATAAVRPLQNSLLPSLARSPEELVASNVATSAGEGIGVLLGPGVGGLLLVVGPAAAAAAGAVGMLLATVAFTQIRPEAKVPHRAPRRRLGPLSGLAALRRMPVQALHIAVFGVQPFVRGVLTVIIVVASIELLGLGEPGVGLLNSAVGLGGIVGAIASIALVGRVRMAFYFWLGLAFWGLPISVVGLVPVPPVAVAAMVVVGIANAILDVSGFTLLQRTVPNDVRASVLGLFEGYIAAMAGLGGIAAPVLLEAFGTQGALVVTGMILPVLATITWPGLRRTDAIALVPERELRLLRGCPMFAGLPMTVIEQLADGLIPVDAAAGDELMRQGEPGDRFVLIADGTVEVEQDGTVVRSVGPGGYVGEIALLREIPRTATVRAVSDVAAFVLERVSFIAAVTGDPGAIAAAEQVVRARLANASE